MGWDSNRFVNKPSDRLCCSICLDVFASATLLPCAHTYCKSCLEGLAEDQRKCPRDQQQFSLDQLKPNFDLQSFVDEQLISCRHLPCRKQVKLEDLETHEFNCDHNVLICNKGCDLQIRANEVADHSCLQKLKDAIANDRDRARNVERELEERDITITELRDDNTSIQQAFEAAMDANEKLRQEYDELKEKFSRRLQIQQSQEALSSEAKTSSLPMIPAATSRERSDSNFDEFAYTPVDQIIFGMKQPVGVFKIENALVDD